MRRRIVAHVSRLDSGHNALGGVLAETEGENTSHPFLNKLKYFRRQALLCGTVCGTVWTISDLLPIAGLCRRAGGNAEFELRQGFARRSSDPSKTGQSRPAFLSAIDLTATVIFWL